MPELPEVERAVVRLRRHLSGRRIEELVLHHPALRRGMSTAERRSIAGCRVVGIRRRGKHQLIDLDDGRVLHAHFRMTGDWATGAAAWHAQYPRATLRLEDGSRVVLDDPRALSTVRIAARGIDPVADVGPDADDPSLTTAWLADRFAKRRVAVKGVLLDQSEVAGIGNIYAVESLWRARIDPRRPANSLSRREIRGLLTSVRAVLRRATGARYGDHDARFAVYDREGKPCRRCRKTIARIQQAARSTYFCPNCQQ